MSKKKPLLFFTNLHPLPWQETRATYNLEETKHLSEHYNIKKLIPVPWFIWLKQVLVNGYRTDKNTCLFPFFYVPKVMTSLHPLFLGISIVISVKPLLWLLSANRVIASWAYAEGVCAAFFKGLVGNKLIIESLGSDINALMTKPLHKRQMKWAFKKATFVTGKSQALVTAIHSHTSRVNAEVVYNGVDFESFTLRSSPVFTSAEIKLVFIGSVIKTKGIFELIDAIALLKKQNCTINLNLLGAGAQMKDLEERISQLGVADSVNLVGPIPHDSLMNFIHDSDALILPSYREGVPNVVMESLSTGTPVIVTKVGGIPEVVQENTNGVFINALSGEGVMEAILKAKNTEWQCNAIRASISHLTWANTAQHIQSLLEIKQ
ncbi:glycosyltransferase family 4 protein [Alteromonas sp. KS69]|jgi:glycosyltransferase involved in cell wall biosynthesis|uniref:glycosyltransferase n=1 Tax=Alteromonas sp. KS69 TaxID=2109917 RepID=UPI000F867361|nr:glycosyltransferase [Alteromonas sp. KS69]RUP83391.1 glycosyltransferase family 4 protein [Alteromonas sp. KS69]|tara:strand:+ start:3142 stop:4275 length:1134 start_codon:yes stop_codon:yes gene_type:complete